MKKRLKLVFAVLLGLITIGGLLSYAFVPWDAVLEAYGTRVWVDTDFATRAHVTNNYLNNKVGREITDPHDVKVIKKILRGCARKNGIADMFDEGVSVTLTDGQKSVTFCPDFDGSPMLYVSDTEGRYRHLSCLQNRRLYHILNKYGMDLPVSQD